MKSMKTMFIYLSYIKDSLNILGLQNYSQK